ncbi:MAG: sigma-54-dependent transcriptional regulator [Planctomycetota bacterium]|jgi:DNA-binding NtrC family response regulator
MTEAMYKTKILVVDDAEDTVEVLRRNLTLAGYQVFTAPGVGEAIRFLEVTPVELVVTDMKMPGASGLELVRHVMENLRDTEVMMITGYATVEGAVEAVKTGADEYLAKPFTDEELLNAVSRALENRKIRLVGRNGIHMQGLSQYGLIGESVAMQEAFRTMGKAADVKATVLIAGESGTGKELVARAIHYSGSLRSGPFVPVNCGGIPEGLLESELFGHLKGSFTGATETRAGFFQTADGGTIFLDEISEISPGMQVKLLRVLQDKEVCMVGDVKPRKVNVRILAATNKDLRVLIDKGLFREDLYFRLNVITLDVPPLRARGHDVWLLAQHFIEKFAEDLGKDPIRLSDRALKVIRDYDWPGNVRELENLIHRLSVMAEEALIDASDLPSLMRFSAPRNSGLNRTLAEVEAEHIRNVLAGADGNKTRAAEILGIDRKTLREKLKRYSLDA